MTEQYSRKDFLILSGGGFSEMQSGTYETPEEAREIVKKVYRRQTWGKIKWTNVCLSQSPVQQACSCQIPGLR